MSLIDFVAGCWGGACGVLVGHPLDTIKVRLQTNPENVNLSTLLFNRNQRLGGLFSGLSSPLACLAFVNAIVFGVYGNLNEYLKTLEATSEPKMSKVGREFIAGTVSGVAQCLITCPMELVKCRMQMAPLMVASKVSLFNQPDGITFVTKTPNLEASPSSTFKLTTNNMQTNFHTLNSNHQQPLNHQQQRQFHDNYLNQRKTFLSSLKHHQSDFLHSTNRSMCEKKPFLSRNCYTSTETGQPSIRDVIREIKLNEKSYLRGLYRGMIPTLLRDAPAFGIYFSSFQYLIDRNPEEETSETKLLVAGGLAGALSWVFIYPMDVIKTKIQTEGRKYDYSLIKCTKSMYKESKSGMRIFFRGFTPTLLRAFPVNAVTFYIVNKTFVLYENYL